MKTIVNNTPKLRWEQNEYYVLYSSYDNTKTILNDIFNAILYITCDSKTESELRSGMKLIEEQYKDYFGHYFAYGFGSNHMWVKQLTNEGKTIEDNMIYIEF